MINSVELRPCIVKTKKALFHRWSNNVLLNGLNERVGDVTIAIIEYEDGSVGSVYPSEVKFVDRKINEFGYAMDFKFLKDKEEGKI